MILSVLFSLAYILASGLLHLMFSSLQLLSRVRLFVTPWTAAHHASLSITNSLSSLKFMSIESVMPTNHLILCCPLLLLPSIFPSMRVFSNESVLHIRWPKYWSFSFSISPSSEYSALISCRENGNHSYRKLTKRDHLDHSLSNSVKLWTMLCRATQDGQVMVKSSDKTWCIGEGIRKPLQCSCLEDPVNSIL